MWPFWPVNLRRPAEGRGAPNLLRWFANKPSNGAAGAKVAKVSPNLNPLFLNLKNGNTGSMKDNEKVARIYGRARRRARAKALPKAKGSQGGRLRLLNPPPPGVLSPRLRPLLPGGLLLLALGGARRARARPLATKVPSCPPPFVGSSSSSSSSSQQLFLRSAVAGFGGGVAVGFGTLMSPKPVTGPRV